MKVYVIATEASGDYLGSNLMKEFKKRKINVKGIGGKLMEKEGLNSWVPIQNFNTIGLFEVLVRVSKFLKILKKVETIIKEDPPDILITIDSPSFNSRLVKRLQSIRKKTKMIHYVAPTVWAWKKYRAKKFSNLYDKLFTLFKFEKKYFTKHKLKTYWIGHQIFFKKQKIKKKKIICFLPGSREIEIKKNLNLMKKSIDYITSKYTNYNFYILTFDYFEKTIKKIIKNKNIEIISDYKLKQKKMGESSYAIAASGSVTLELCKYQTPMIVVYDTNFITQIILKLLVKVNYCTLINIFFNKEIIPELIFQKFTYKNLISHFEFLMKTEKYKKMQKKYMIEFSKKMINNGNPSKLLVDNILK